MKSKEVLEVVLFSFGFKYGAPVDVNVIWDVRFLPNPYWVEELRPKTGRVDKVAAYVLESDEGRGFLSLLKPMTTFLIEQNSAAEKKNLHMGIGCTGGRHRSVAVTEALSDFLEGLSIEHTIYHRDIERDSRGK
ncbi:MAG: hypothetical protein BA862_02820 [Desulfobulbaceae bacterium S3730MH12]|nr:MAG: hypothetical protein BA866_10905 [Desulfobulbaceae bacterium S5133MH15]OEU58263.1 MAG: hypothetical protein BA862_02820 [Desulfobulbaceae bacterium S3730MH12]OEU82486.1 MAG: hypothetical protein BA873_02085 [Desulfobulbaceae bacterium C00003063]